MLLRITLLFLLLTVLPTALLSLSLPRRHRRFLLWLPALVLLAGAVFLFFGAGYISTQPSVWRTRLQTAIIFMALPQLSLAFFLLIGKLFNGKIRRAIHISGGLSAILLIVLQIYGLTVGQSRITTREFVVADKRIPAAFDGYRIALLSDLHVGTHHADSTAMARKIEAVNATRPDLICFLGDLVNFSEGELTEFIPQLSRLRAADGVLSVMGNHDFLIYDATFTPDERAIHVRKLQAIQREMGWKLLLNENFKIRRGADSLVIIGVENDGEPPMPQRADLPRALLGTDSSAYRILLTHDPTHWQRAIVGRHDIPLTFSGHTHGMQFALPGGWSPAAWRYEEWKGLYTAGYQRLFITTGLGENTIPFRLNMPPEVAVCTLRHID